MTEQQDTSPIKVPDALMSAMGFTVAELNAGRTIVETDFTEFVDPAFQAKVAEYIARDDASFATWLAESDMGAHIDCARQAARAAFADPESVKDLPAPDDERTTWLEIDFAHRRAQPLIQALDNAGVGFAEIQAWGWFINSDHVLGKRRRGQYGTARQNHAAVEAFAMALSRPGFELKITRE